MNVSQDLASSLTVIYVNQKECHFATLNPNINYSTMRSTNSMTPSIAKSTESITSSTIRSTDSIISSTFRSTDFITSSTLKSTDSYGLTHPFVIFLLIFIFI